MSVFCVISNVENLRLMWIVLTYRPSELTRKFLTVLIPSCGFQMYFFHWSTPIQYGCKRTLWNDNLTTLACLSHGIFDWINTNIIIIIIYFFNPTSHTCDSGHLKHNTAMCVYIYIWNIILLIISVFYNINTNETVKYYRMIKKSLWPCFSVVIIRCTETFWLPCT
jgi:hypothetical protein